MKRIVRSAIVERSAAALYALVEDIERYPDFLPWCADAQVHERSGERTVATITLGFAGLRYSFTTQNINTPGASIEMELVEGPFRVFLASWRFKELAPAVAKIEFSLLYEFSSTTIAVALEPLFSRIADNMVDAFTRRAMQSSA